MLPILLLPRAERPLILSILTVLCIFDVITVKFYTFACKLPLFVKPTIILLVFEFEVCNSENVLAKVTMTRLLTGI